MSILSSQADELRKTANMAANLDDFERVSVPWMRNKLAPMLREAADTIESLRDRLHESCGQVPEQEKRGNGSERESCGEVCGDDRFELIDKAKRKLLECTNIESRPEEVAVLDSILFRCWQMGWLDKLRDDESRYADLFGTPERAARTLTNIATVDGCEDCALLDATCCRNERAWLEWLKG